MATDAPLADRLPAIADDAVAICTRLLQIDSSNFGDGSGPGERAAGEYVMELLTEVGWSPEYFETGPRRAGVVLRVPGIEPDLPALVIHGHLDVVPAQAEDWQVPPFAGELIDDHLWGRGAVDMKDMDAMMLAIARDMARSDWRGRREIIFAFFPDEEAGGVHGSHWVAANRPDLLEGATEAISEVGGFSVDVGGRRLYLLQTAEKGLAWLRLIAEGTAGHGSAVNTDNAVTELAGAIARIGAYAWPTDLTGTVRQLLAGVADLTGLAFDPQDPTSIEALLAALGPARRFVGSSISALANPTGLQAGYKANVIPGRAEASVDCRPLPGRQDEAIAKLAELAGPGVRIEPIHADIGLEVPFDGPLVDTMIGCLRREDPEATVLPYLLSAGTDNKALATLGIAGYGFVPLRLPTDLDFTALFHGVDERIPIESIRFGTRVLADLIATAH